MNNLILVEGDIVQFMPLFGAAVVTPQPGTLQGSGPATLNAKKVCVDGDEKNVSVPNCPYMTPQYCIPGSGTLKIDSLAGNQKAKKTKTGGKAVLLKGRVFTARFEVQCPAQQPLPLCGTVPDPNPQYDGGIGQFITTNVKFTAS